MSTTQASRLLSPEQIAVQAGQQVPFLRFPVRASVFAERETRLRQLAAGHPMRDYLMFVAEIARAQHETLQQHPAVALPTAEVIEQAARLGLPTLPATGPRDPVWRTQLRGLLERLAARLVGNPALPAVQALRDADDDHLERQADRLLSGVMLDLDLGTAPLIAAGLQVHWTHRVLATQEARGADRLAPFGQTDDLSHCPCCGSRPTASISRIGADESGYRYLHCALCSTQWHMVRIKCTHCLGTKGIGYQSLQALVESDAASARLSKAERAVREANAGAVQVETCEGCGHYLKIVHMAKNPEVDPVADDLATITLDLLVSETGLERHGVNLMLLFGEPDPDHSSAAATAPPPGAA